MNSMLNFFQPLTFILGKMHFNNRETCEATQTLNLNEAATVPSFIKCFQARDLMWPNSRIAHCKLKAGRYLETLERTRNKCLIVGKVDFQQMIYKLLHK